MRKILILDIFLPILLGCATEIQTTKPTEKSIPPEPEPPPGWINPDQPIPVGQRIFKYEYFWTDNYFGYRVVRIRYYDYLGVDDKNNIKILYKYVVQDSGKNEKDAIIMLLPLNEKKQTILRVEVAKYYNTTRDLLITIVDEFNRITVREILKTQTK